VSGTSVRQASSLPRLETSAIPAPLRAAAMRGLTDHVKTLPPALFYDARGAQLFEQICEVPEYYPTRTELGILSRCAPQLAEAGRA
jgi:uncharacterized SAM-dependent methyltransferase